MKLRLFLVCSLALLGFWLAAAYQHENDLQTYVPDAPDFATTPVTSE